MVPFSGYELPVQYPSGIIAEHKWTREHAGLFDVSHMGPSFLELAAPSGNHDADHAAIAALVEPLICGDIKGLKPGQIRYTLLLNQSGGTLDDLMVARSARVEYSGTLYIVVNAGTKETDFAAIEAAARGKAKFSRADDGALLALQGPEAGAVMAAFIPAAANLGFMNYGSYDWQGARLMISRSGYTGEDGFEMLIPADRAAAVWDALLADPRVKPVGLGARDSLRLEAGLPLYGHDLTPDIDPIEAGFGFAIARRRRATGGFPGHARILAALTDGPARRRVGLSVTGRMAAREGAVVMAGETPIGLVTSGGFAPSLDHPVAMALIDAAHAVTGTELTIDVRGRAIGARVVPLPFVPHRYHRKGIA